MKNLPILGLVLPALILLVAGTETKAQYSRRTPVVEAVQKTQAGIVTVKAEKTSTPDEVRETIGTGVVVDERGYLITNQHIVAGATRVRILLADQKELPATVLAADEEHDLAVLVVTGSSPLSPLTFGPGSDLMVGESVIAVGHPYGFRQTVSTGIISALDRDITMGSGQVLSHLIQTDASINPGNSGGPLLNINGEVIGMVVGLREGARGIAFAINADTIKDVLTRNLSGSRLAGIRHGLTCADEVLEPEGSNRQRVVVAAVGEETPAAKAGLERGDQIRCVAGRPVANRFDVERALWDQKSGQRVNFLILRGGKELQLPLTLGTATTRETMSVSRPPTPGQPGGLEKAAGSEAPLKTGENQKPFSPPQHYSPGMGTIHWD